MRSLLLFSALALLSATCPAQTAAEARAHTIAEHARNITAPHVEKDFSSCVPVLPPSGNTTAEPAFTTYASWADRGSTPDQFHLAVWHLACDGTLVVRVTPVKGVPFICSPAFVVLQGGRQFDSANLVTSKAGSGFCGDLYVPTSFYLSQWSHKPQFDTRTTFTLLFEGVWATYPLSVGAYVPPVIPTALTVEFYNTTLNHFFMTANAAEIASVDGGGAGPGWARTGASFRVHTTQYAGTQAVCRFYGTPGKGPNSHFYTINPSECSGVRADPGWTYEGTAFYAIPWAGFCPSGYLPLYRSYNRRWQQNDSNHRFTTSAYEQQNMVHLGWADEGPAMCVLPPS